MFNMLESLSAADFDPHVGTAFVTGPRHEPIVLELVSVTPLPEPPARPGRLLRPRPFSLIFRAQTADHLPQGTFALVHDRFGTLDVFLVPVGREPDGLLLEAVFA